MNIEVTFTNVTCTCTLAGAHHGKGGRADKSTGVMECRCWRVVGLIYEWVLKEESSTIDIRKIYVRHSLRE